MRGTKVEREIELRILAVSNVYLKALSHLLLSYRVYKCVSVCDTIGSLGRHPTTMCISSSFLEVLAYNCSSSSRKPDSIAHPKYNT